EECLRFLVRDQVPPPSPTPADGEDLSWLAGYYRDVTPAEAIWAPLVDVAGGLEIQYREGEVWGQSAAITGPRSLLTPAPRHRILPVGEGAFRREDESVSSVLVFRTDHGGQVLVTQHGYLEKSPLWLTAAKRILLAGAVLCLLSAFVLIPVW